MTTRRKRIEELAEVEEPAQDFRRGVGLPVSSLAILETFKYEGGIYSKRRTSPDGVRALSVKGDSIITLAPHTLVTPV